MNLKFNSIFIDINYNSHTLNYMHSYALTFGFNHEYLPIVCQINLCVTGNFVIKYEGRIQVLQI